MKRVVVIGSGGAGKSTFSRRLGGITGIEVIHLDGLYWRPNWEKTPVDEWERTVAGLVEGESWIMDGNFGGTRKMRIAAADTVIFLDVPRLRCIYRVLKRALKFRSKSRPDMASGCNEKIDAEFIGWIWNYPSRARSRIFSEVEQFPEKDFVILKSDRDTEDFLKRATETYGS